MTDSNTAAHAPSSSAELPKTYEPAAAERRWYEFWEKEGLFRASDAPGDTRATYTIAIPPPNVTGVLHMGHACRVTFEDVLIRYHRMRGFNTLWIPGTDHAGIATQVVVERRLRAEGLSKDQLGREEFVRRVWEWKEQSGGTILRQQRFLGASCDWSRERFTLDPELSEAVRTVFVRLYEEGLIYRDTRLTNWCVRCKTALSDLEVVNQEGATGELFDFAYPLEDGQGELVVSTTRPETLLGDTAVAVHPEDPRYLKLHGKSLVHPFTARRIPIITDAELVDPKFGTGAVKVTPAHDHNDFATGKRHQLEEINVLERNGTMNSMAGEFQGLERFAARKAVKAALEARGLARGSRAHTLTIPRCDRCNEVVEPLITTQWYVKMKPLAEPAIAAVEDGRTKIIPEHWTKTYYHWMHNIQDWCISRQLWWGHPIPALHCERCDHIEVSLEAPDACSRCGGALTPDPDVLDTWFSSALWPFSTLGWPKQTVDLERFYPTQDLETGYDILFFWVARMMMMGLHFMGDVPFKRVLLAGMVTDEHGKKMSKVKGNTLDPLDVIGGASLDQLLEKAKFNGATEAGTRYIKKTYADGIAPCGADALRFTLLGYSPQTTKIALSLQRIEGNRNFCNKLWNAARYVLRSVGPAGTQARVPASRPEPKALANRWVISRLATALESAGRGVDDYRLDEASLALYHYVWDEFCDWYLELSKPLLDGASRPASASDAARIDNPEGSGEVAAETRATLLHCFETLLRALHPMMPFITEELWQRLPKSSSAPKSIVIARYPQPTVDAAADPTADAQMQALQEVIVAARTIRAEYSIDKRTRLPLRLLSTDAETRRLLSDQELAISSLCGADVSVEAGDAQAEAEGNALRVAGKATVLVALAGLVDPAQEVAKIERELGKLEKDLKVVSGRLASDSFVSRAPEAVVAKERARLSELLSAKAKLEASAAQLARTTQSV